MGPSIFIEQLSLQYGNDTILDNLNLTLEGGHIHLFVGPNGGGKTSLLKSILGLTPFQGEIQIHGEYRIGYVPQKAQFEYSLPLSVMDFMLLSQSRQPLFLGSHRRAREKAMVQLERLGMASRAERRMGQLSGGEQQRVLFAQALLDAPNLLVLDEPTTGMDKQGIEIIDNCLMNNCNMG